MSRLLDPKAPWSTRKGCFGKLAALVLLIAFAFTSFMGAVTRGHEIGPAIVEGVEVAA